MSSLICLTYLLLLGFQLVYVVKACTSDGLGLGTAGTRRTVYLSGDEGNTNTDHDERSQTLPADMPRPTTPHQEPSVLVYNRVTAVIGDDRTPPASPVASSRKGSTSGTPSKKANTWYEYGCV